MAETPPHHLREAELPGEEIRLRRGSAILLIGIFLLILVVPTLWNELSEFQRPEFQRRQPAGELVRAILGTNNAGRPIEERLRRFEDELEQRFVIAAPTRRFAQDTLLNLLKTGNQKTLIGREGWLFYRPEIQALTGIGLLSMEPDSVARDPSKTNWQPPLPVLLDFANQLKERGIELWLVPVPMKESIYPEKLTGTAAAGPVLHPDETHLAQMCEAAGIKYIQLAPLLWKMKEADASEGGLYLRQDSHWSPRGMRAAAKLIADLLRAKPHLSGTIAFGRRNVEAASRGDLVEKLDLREPGRHFREEHVQLVSISDARPDAASPVVLLGDSFVNIFHDPSLGFGAEGLIHAGFAQHLMAELGAPVDVLASNGGGATTVREQFARRPDDLVRKKKVVVWMLSARDLFLARTEAMVNGVEWRKVQFNPRPSSENPNGTNSLGLQVEATVLEISKFPPNPTLAPYADALVSVKYKVDAVKSGKFGGAEIVVMHWLFKKREFSAAAQLRPGDRCLLTLQPWSDALDVYKIRMLDDFDQLENYYQDSPVIME